MYATAQGGQRGFMSGIAELKAGPTHEQQQRARDLRERLLNDLQEQVTQHKQATLNRFRHHFAIAGMQRLR